LTVGLLVAVKQGVQELTLVLYLDSCVEPRENIIPRLFFYVMELEVQLDTLNLVVVPYVKDIGVVLDYNSNYRVLVLFLF
jgi:hypothetical protein